MFRMVEHARAIKAKQRAERSVQSVERALELFEMVARADGEVGTRDLSEASGLPIATVHRLIQVLVKKGYARRNSDSRRYSLGHRAFELVFHIREEGAFRREAQPYLRELVALTSETANLATLEGNQITYVAQVEAPRMVRMFTAVGNRVPAHACAAGKALVAYLSEDRREAFLLRSPLTRYTANTITDRERLRHELSKIRNQGYALDEGEYEEGVRCVAVPLLNSQQAPVASLSVSGPSSRIPRERVDAWVPKMKVIARALIHALHS